MAGSARRSTSLILAGTTVRADNVLLLASKLDGDPLAQKLERGVANGNTIVALSDEDRQRIVDVLADSPSGLAELRSTLAGQLKKKRDRELKDQRSAVNQELTRRHLERLREQGTDAGTNAHGG
jgi:hypothetical protein